MLALSLLALFALALLVARRDWDLLAGYTATVALLAGLVFGMRLEGLALFYVFCALGFLPVLLLGREKPGASQRGRRRDLSARAAKMLSLLLPFVFVLLALGFFTIIKGMGATTLAATPISMANLVVRKGHALELVGVSLIIFSLVYHAAIWREVR